MTLGIDVSAALRHHTHMPERWSVTTVEAGTRLDVFLTHHVAGLTRSQAKKRIEAGEFTVNGKPASGHRFLKEGDVIAGGAGKPRPAGDGMKRRAMRSSQETSVEQSGETPPLRIIAETPDWIVVDKPAGLLMHPDARHPNQTLIDAVVAHAPEVAKVGEDPNRPGIVSRLDKDVSGLVVIAKTQAALDGLKKQFAEHRVIKEYLALVYGEVPKDEGEIRFRIGRSTSKARMAARPSATAHGQAAWTHYEVCQRFRGASLLKLQILTGRTHQIRAHLHAFGHPVMGDRLYQPKKLVRKLAPPRLMLQSVALAFDDPKTGELKRFRLEPAPEFASLMQRL